jgi:hypothetical protein
MFHWRKQNIAGTFRRICIKRWFLRFLHIYFRIFSYRLAIGDFLEGARFIPLLPHSSRTVSTLLSCIIADRQNDLFILSAVCVIKTVQTWAKTFEHTGRQHEKINCLRP